MLTLKYNYMSFTFFCPKLFKHIHFLHRLALIHWNTLLIIWGLIPTFHTHPSVSPSFLLLSFLSPDQNLSRWVKAVLRKPPSISIHSHQITGTRREEREGRRGASETDWASAREQWVSLWAGVWGWRERKRNPAESFWRRMCLSPLGLTGMHCRCGCYRQCGVIWWEIIRGGEPGSTNVHAYIVVHVKHKRDIISRLPTVH